MKKNKILISSIILAVLVVILIIDLSLQYEPKSEVDGELISKMDWDKVSSINIPGFTYLIKPGSFFVME